MTPWVKLDNDYYDHRKFAEAGPLTELLWVRMLAWSHRNLTDGVVPVRAVKRLCDFLCEVGELEVDDHDPFTPKGVELTWSDLVDRGVDAGLFEAVDDTGTAMRVHGYTEKQNTADLVAARREAGRRGGIKSGQVRQKWQPNEPKEEANPEATGEANGQAGAKPNPSRGQASAEPDVRCQMSDNRSIQVLLLSPGCKGRSRGGGCGRPRFPPSRRTLPDGPWPHGHR